MKGTNGKRNDKIKKCTRENGRAPKRRKENLEELSRSIGNLYISNKTKKKKAKKTVDFEAPHIYSKMKGKCHSLLSEKSKINSTKN